MLQQDHGGDGGRQHHRGTEPEQDVRTAIPRNKHGCNGFGRVIGGEPDFRAGVVHRAGVGHRFGDGAGVLRPGQLRRTGCRYRGGGGHRRNGRHGREGIAAGASHRREAASDRRGQGRIGCGDHRYPQVLGQCGGDDRDPRATAGTRDGGQVTGTDSVALHGIPQHQHEFGQRGPQLRIELVAGQPHLGPVRRQIDLQRGGDHIGQPFLGRPALVAQPRQRTERRRPRRPGRGVRQIGQHATQQGLVDHGPGQFQMAHHRPDRAVAVGGVDEGDAGARPTEIAYRDGTPSGQTWVVGQRGGGGTGVVDQCGAGQFGCRCQCRPQRIDRGRTPVHRMGDAELRCAAPARQHRAQRLDQQRLRAVR